MPRANGTKICFLSKIPLANNPPMSKMRCFKNLQCLPHRQPQSSFETFHPPYPLIRPQKNLPLIPLHPYISTPLYPYISIFLYPYISIFLYFYISISIFSPIFNPFLFTVPPFTSNTYLAFFPGLILGQGKFSPQGKVFSLI